MLCQKENYYPKALPSHRNRIIMDLWSIVSVNNLYVEFIFIVRNRFRLAMMPTSESEISRFYTVLGHPLRRSMIKIIGETGSASFTDLRTRLKVSVGTLYYNIDLMEGLVAQDESKRYILTSQGKIAYQLLVESEEKLVSLGVEAERRSAWLKSLTRVFAMRGLFSYLYESPKLSLPSAVTIVVYGMWITYQAQLFPIIVLYSERPMLPVHYIPVLFIGGWIIINILGNFIPFVLYSRPREGADCLLIGSSYALLPSLTLPTLWVAFEFLRIRLSLIAAQLIMLVSMGYSLCLLTTAISMAKGVRIEKAALVSLVTLYLAAGLSLAVYRF